MALWCASFPLAFTVGLGAITHMIIALASLKEHSRAMLDAASGIVCLDDVLVDICTASGLQTLCGQGR